MDNNRIVSILHRQSPTYRRVMLLLAFLNEHGPKTYFELMDELPTGIKGEVAVAVRCNYVIRISEERLALTSRGRDVMAWLLGTAEEPSHWREGRKAMKKRVDGKVRNTITLTRKLIRHANH